MELQQPQPEGDHQAEPRDGPERARADGPRIYVASLSDYNAGILHGAWLDATEDPEDIESGISAMLASSPTTARYGDIAEEWAIHDYEGFAAVRLGEYESIGRVAVLARGILQFGEPFAAWWAYEEPDRALGPREIYEQFEESYQGEFESVEDYAEGYLDDIGFDLDQVRGLPDHLRPYITVDTVGLATDLQAGGAIYTTNSPRGVYVFSNI